MTIFNEVDEMLRHGREVLCGLMVLLSLHASAGVLRIATLSPDGSAWMQTLRGAATEIKQRTAGRVDFRFYTGGTMGNDRTVLSKVRLGELQGAAVTASSLDPYVHDLDLYSLPMLFDDFAAVDKARKVMDPWLSRQLEDAGWANFGFAEGGFAYIMSRQAPIASLAELRQHKVWIPEGDRFSATALGAFRVTPVPLSLGDVLPGLQTGIIDVVASSPIAVLALQWQTQVHQMTDLPMSYFT
ncbi:MAG: TRAP transporter substrate-binding protein DctP, partial [Pseudomonadales bacterium]|nr:TRAP transporter substrate-binding protein DctP [Pseudomonadales bacterium]